MATVAASITVTRHGAVDAMPTLAEIRAGIQ
jgi:sugar/nucleoside kinase (ribokinase family)